VALLAKPRAMIEELRIIYVDWCLIFYAGLRYVKSSQCYKRISISFILPESRPVNNILHI
jgi:hypothetical protein